jgi:glycosyltransferase involved in cell wall biosynthesis
MVGIGNPALDEFLPVAILVPSLNRPQRLLETVRHIRTTTPKPFGILFCVSDDESRSILQAMGESFIDDGDCEDKRYVTRMNKMVKHLGEARSVFFGSDDVIHRPGWFEAAASVLSDGYAVAVVNDLKNGQGTQALVRTDYLSYAVFDDPDSVFHPGYLHNFADNEMFYTATVRGVCGRALDSIVEHLHPVMGGPLPWDSTYQIATDGWNHDVSLFEERVKLINEAFGVTE